MCIGKAVGADDDVHCRRHVDRRVALASHGQRDRTACRAHDRPRPNDPVEWANAAARSVERLRMGHEQVPQAHAIGLGVVPTQEFHPVVRCTVFTVGVVQNTFGALVGRST